MLCYKTECLQPDIRKSLKESVLISFGSMRHFENEKSGPRKRDVSMEEKFFYSSPELIQWSATVVCCSRQCAVFSLVYTVLYTVQCAMFEARECSLQCSD